MGGPIAFLPARDHRWRAGESGRARQGGGGCSLGAKQEVAQHLFLGTQRGSGQPAVCVFRNVFCFKQDLHPDGRCDILPLLQMF